MSPTEATGRRLPLIGAAVAVLLLLLAGLAGAKSLRDLKAAHERERNLEQRIAATRDQIDSLRTRIVRLRSDPGLLERLAREELGFVRPKDVIVELPLPVTAAVALAPPTLPSPPSPASEATESLTPRPRGSRVGTPATIALPPSDAPPVPE